MDQFALKRPRASLSLVVLGGKMKIVLEYVLLFIVLTALSVSSIHSATKRFTLTIDAPENKVMLGTEVKIGVTLKNSSDRAIDISTGSDDLDYVIEIHDQQGRLASATDFALKSRERASYSSDTIFKLQPGESLPKVILVVTKFWTLNRPGRYTVQVSRKASGDETVRSNSLTITMTKQGSLRSTK
jgi:uncharacterized protein (DUF58 family)